MRAGAAVRAAFTVCLAVLLLLCGAGAVSAAPSGYWYEHYTMSWLGDYTATSSYSITCNEDLAALAVAVNNDTGLYNFTGKTVTVTNNSLDLSAHYWTPIGNTTENDPDHSTRIFQGTFDGGLVGETRAAAAIPTAGGPSDCSTLAPWSRTATHGGTWTSTSAARSRNPSATSTIKTPPTRAR